MRSMRVFIPPNFAVDLIIETQSQSAGKEAAAIVRRKMIDQSGHKLPPVSASDSVPQFYALRLGPVAFIQVE